MITLMVVLVFIIILVCVLMLGYFYKRDCRKNKNDNIFKVRIIRKPGEYKGVLNECHAILPAFYMDNKMYVVDGHRIIEVSKEDVEIIEADSVSEHP